jgi:hypothetical protein
MAFALLLATSAHAQTSQFLFDANGNLTVQRPDFIAPPQITGQPQNQIVATNESAAFSVIVADPRSLTHQWRFNGADIGGETGVSLLLDNVSTNNEGQYQVVLTNPSGSVTSAPAMLWIDNDGDGLGDSWELTYFLNLTNTATADFDGDRVSNLQEFLDATNPTNSASARYRLLVIPDGGAVTKSLDQTSYANGEPVTLTAIASPGGEHFHGWLGDIATRANPVTLVMTNDKTVYARFTPIAFTWTSPASGDWETATNWTPNFGPGSNDTVIIARNVTVTLNSPADCADVTLGAASFSPTLTGSGTLTVRGNFLWASGTMSGSGRTVIVVGATLNLSPPNPVSLNSRTLENGGTVLWTGAGSVNLTSSVITNRPGALFHAQNAAAFLFFGGACRFDNAGTFRKSLNAGPLTVGSVSFNNSGAVEIQTGTWLCSGTLNNNGVVNLSAGTTNRLEAGGSATGLFTAPATALVEWTGGTFTLNPGAQLTGPGFYRINNGTLTANTDLTVENLDLIAGTLGGTGVVTISNAMNWTGGTMSGGGRTIIPFGATLNLSPPSSVSLSSRTLENGGTVLWTGAGNVGLANGVITNRPGALFHAQNAAAFLFFGGACRFDNAGTFRKSLNAGPLTVGSSVSFNNSGAVEIQTGTLRLAGGGSATGTFDAPDTTAVEWTGGTFTLNPGAQLNGSGLYKLNGGSVTANANLTVENLDIVHSGSSLGGAGMVTMASAMNWTAGNMSGMGRTLIAPGATLHAATPSSVNLSARTLENGGTVVFTGAGIFGVNSSAVITNRPGALFRIENENTLGLGGVANGRFDNAGTFRKSAGTGTTTMTSGMKFTNYNTVDIRSGKLAANGGYASSSNALLNCALGGTTPGTGHGQLQVAGAVTLNGALSVDFVNGFSPALNDTFTVVAAGTRNGAFSNFLYPSNVVTMQLSNSPTSVIVRVTEVAPPPPTVLPPVLSSSNVLLCWTAVSNTTYRVEYNPDLGPTNWSALPGDVIATNSTACKVDVLTSSNRFYRVRVLP